MLYQKQISLYFFVVYVVAEKTHHEEYYCCTYNPVFKGEVVIVYYHVAPFYDQEYDTIDEKSNASDLEIFVTNLWKRHSTHG